MNTIHDKEKPKFSFSQPATYEIRVLGKVPESYAESLSDMTISYKKSKGEVVTILIGLMRDQASLSGVLNSLYDLHMSVISVKKMENPTKTK